LWCASHPTCRWLWSDRLHTSSVTWRLRPLRVWLTTHVSTCASGLRVGSIPWALKRQGRERNVRVRGQLVFNTIDLILDAALAGFGLAYLPVDQVDQHLESGMLVATLEDCCPALPGYHLYYPNRKPSAAFGLLIEALRYKS